MNDSVFAFPILFNDGGRQMRAEYGGMTLRDYFAAKAMQGMLTANEFAMVKTVAGRAYKMAEAMLEARQQ